MVTGPDKLKNHASGRRARVVPDTGCCVNDEREIGRSTSIVIYSPKEMKGPIGAGLLWSQMARCNRTLSFCELPP